MIIVLLLKYEGKARSVNFSVQSDLKFLDNNILSKILTIKFIPVKENGRGDW